MANSEAVADLPSTYIHQCITDNEGDISVTSKLNIGYKDFAVNKSFGALGKNQRCLISNDSPKYTPETRNSSSSLPILEPVSSSSDSIAMTSKNASLFQYHSPVLPMDEQLDHKRVDNQSQRMWSVENHDKNCKRLLNEVEMRSLPGHIDNVADSPVVDGQPGNNADGNIFTALANARHYMYYDA